MSAFKDILLGSGGKVQQGPPLTSSLSGAQQGTQFDLSQVLNSLLTSNPTFGNISQPFDPGTISTTPAQNNVLNAIEGAVGPTSGGGQTVTSAESALQSLMSANPIDVSKYFNDVVATPLENTFNQKTLPGIKSAFARSAGGTYGDKAQQAAGFAAQDLDTQLQSAMTNLATQSLFNNQATRLNAAQAAPGVAMGAVSPLSTALQSLLLPTNLQQQNISNRFAGYNSNVQALLNLLGTTSGFTNAPTMTQNAAVIPPSQGLLSSQGGGQAMGAGLAALMMM